MEKIIFYSWQSDLPNASNRGFIEKALIKASEGIKDDNSIEVEPVVDRDTAGVGGSPDISTTIFDKIKNSDIFVADVSIINRDFPLRKTPNPNVLIELGYALMALGHNRVILVMNEEFGGPELLPFDLKMRKVVTYNTTKEKGEENKNLVGRLQYELKIVLQNGSSIKDSRADIFESIENQKPDRASYIKNYMQSLNDGLVSLYPGDGMLDSTNDDPEYDQKIIDALKNTLIFIPTFRDVVDKIALYNDIIALKALFQGFKPIIENYDRKRNTPDGTFHRARYDYYKFLGNELFVILFSILLREERWELLKFILDETIIVDNYDGNEVEAVDFTYFSNYAICFEFRKKRLNSNRIDLRYDLLMERRKLEVGQAQYDIIEEYTSADLLLFLKGESQKVNSTDILYNWRPWSLVIFSLPRFILLARKKSYAENIAKILGVEHIQDLQILLRNKIPSLNRNHHGSIFHNPVSKENIDQIGSR